MLVQRRLVLIYAQILINSSKNFWQVIEESLLKSFEIGLYHETNK
jgi:hypothetical protein